MVCGRCAACSSVTALRESIFKTEGVFSIPEDQGAFLGESMGLSVI